MNQRGEAATLFLGKTQSPFLRERSSLKVTVDVILFRFMMLLPFGAALSVVIIDFYVFTIAVCSVCVLLHYIVLLENSCQIILILFYLIFTCI